MLASESSLKNVELTDIESLGTKVAVRYGVQLKLLQSTTDGVEDLTYLLKYCKFFLQGQQRTTESTLRILVRSSFAIHVNFVNPQRSMSLAVVFLPLSTQRKSNNCKVAAQSSRPSHKNRQHRDYVNVQYFLTYLLCPLNECLL